MFAVLKCNTELENGGNTYNNNEKIQKKISQRDLCMRDNKLTKKNKYPFKTYTRHTINYNNISAKQDVNLKSFLLLGKGN